MKTNITFLFALSDPLFRLYMQNGWKFDIFDLLVVIKNILVLMRQLMDTILEIDHLSFHFIYNSPCYIT